MNYKFELDQQEQEAFTAWVEEHDKNCKLRGGGLIGDRFCFDFTPTSIGIFAGVRCPCGENKTLSDYDKY